MNIDKRTARAAGILYVIIILGSIVGGVFSEMFIQSHLTGDMVDTAGAALGSEWLYRMGFAVYMLVYVSDLAVALILYVLLKPVNRSLALLAAFFRFAEAAILAINMLNQYQAFLLLRGDGAMTVFQPDQLQSLANMFLNTHRTGYLVGQVFFGVHCFLLGYLLFKSGYFPRVLGVLLIAASFGYLLESFSYFLFPNYEALESVMTWIVALPAFASELTLTYWLLFKGKTIETRYHQGTATA